MKDLTIEDMEQYLNRLEELHKLSTPVVNWYAHGTGDQCGLDEATVRGPYRRWFVVSGGEGYEKHVGYVDDDAAYAAAAMNSVPSLIAALRQQADKIDKLEKALAGTTEQV